MAHGTSLMAGIISRHLLFSFHASSSPLQGVRAMGISINVIVPTFRRDRTCQGLVVGNNDTKRSRENDAFNVVALVLGTVMR